MYSFYTKVYYDGSHLICKYHQSSDGAYGYDQYQGPGQTPQQPPPPYSKSYPQAYGNKPQYPGGYQGNQNPTMNPGMRPSMMSRQQIVHHFMQNRPLGNPNVNANLAGMMNAGYNNKTGFHNQVRNVLGNVLLQEVRKLLACFTDVRFSEAIS